MSKHPKIRENQGILHQIIQELIKNKQRLLRLTDSPLTRSADIRVIREIEEFENKIDMGGMSRKIKEISHFFSVVDKYDFGKTLIIKAYCFILLACIGCNFHLQGIKYLNDLLLLLNSQEDTQKAIYFIFKVKSLIKLKNYKISENKEYKYDLLTHTLFYYVLSIINKEKSIQLEGRFKEDVDTFNFSQSHCKLLKSMHKKIKIGSSDYLTQEILRQLSKKEKQAEGSTTLSEENEKIQMVLTIARNRSKKFEKVYCLLMKTKGTPHFQMILQHLKQTNLVKRMMEEYAEKEYR